MTMYRGSLMGWMNMKAKIEKAGDITKRKFGEFMHDPGKSDEEKAEFLEKVEGLGGYESLLDDYEL